VGLAYDNNIWVYDDLEAKLNRIGTDGSLLDQTTDLRQFVDSVPDPSVISDQTGLVYLYDAAKGVYIFDDYGSFKKYIPLRGWQDFTVVEKNLLGRNDQFFLKYPFGDINSEVVRVPIPASCLPAIKIIIMPASLYVLRHNELKIYSRH
jgi:hypothetical protein